MPDPRSVRNLSYISPASLIKAGMRAHPAFKFASAAAGLIGLVVVFLQYGVSPAALVFGAIILVVLMVLFLVFSQAAAIAHQAMALPAMVLTWSFLVLCILSAILLFSSAFFNGPLPIRDYLVRQLGIAPDNPKAKVTQSNDSSNMDALVKELRESNRLTREAMANHQNKPSSDEGPAPAELLHRLANLEAEAKRTKAEFEAYAVSHGAPPSEAHQAALQEAEATISDARSLNNRLAFMTAYLAELNLTAKAREQVGELLENRRLSAPDVVGWARTQRDSNPTIMNKWFFCRMPVETTVYDPASNCPEGNCSVAKATEFIAMLSNTALTKAKRQEALEWVIELVTDLHKPLHCTERDHDVGGLKVRIEGAAGRNLHWTWEHDFSRTLKNDKNAEQLVEELNGEILASERRQWAAGRPEDWAWESFQIGVNSVYAPLDRGMSVRLPDGYENNARNEIKRQIEKGGIRLAWVINKALGEN